MYEPSRGEAKRSTVEKLTDVARSLFSPRVQTLIEAGFLTRCNEFTPAFDDAVRIAALEKWGEEIEAIAKARVEADKKASK